jgi:hypothetical protein
VKDEGSFFQLTVERVHFVQELQIDFREGEWGFGAEGHT